jgi:post-segregation antitoxin (ccd killing protein)
MTVRFTTTSPKVAGASTVQRVTTSVKAACATAVGVSRLQELANTAASERFDTWRSSNEESQATGASAPGEFTQRATVPVNVPGLTVIRFQDRTSLGGAVSDSSVRAVVLDNTTGEEITLDGMLAEMQQDGGPRWDFEKELRRAALRSGNPFVNETLVQTLTRKEISAWPTKAGLAVAVDQRRVFAGAAGLVTFTVPWSALVGPKSDMSFIPDGWGH